MCEAGSQVLTSGFFKHREETLDNPDPPPPPGPLTPPPPPSPSAQRVRRKRLPRRARGVARLTISPTKAKPGLKPQAATRPRNRLTLPKPAIGGFGSGSRVGGL